MVCEECGHRKAVDWVFDTAVCGPCGDRMIANEAKAASLVREDASG